MLGQKGAGEGGDESRGDTNTFLPYPTGDCLCQQFVNINETRPLMPCSASAAAE